MGVHKPVSDLRGAALVWSYGLWRTGVDDTQSIYMYAHPATCNCTYSASERCTTSAEGKRTAQAGVRGLSNQHIWAAIGGHVDRVSGYRERELCAGGTVCAVPVAFVLRPYCIW